MTVLFRCRVEKGVLQKADRVAERLGTSTPEMVRIFMTQMARTGKVPLSLDPRDEEAVAGPWPERAARLESFYDPAKTW